MPTNVIARELTGDETMLRSRSQRMVLALTGAGITHVVGVPDNATRFVYELFEAHPEIQVIRVCREGEAWAIASGLWVGGKHPLVVIQNTGFLESGDALRGTAMEMAVPLLALMDYRGYHTLSQGDADVVDSAARLFEPTLRAWQLPYHFLQEGQEPQIIRAALQQAKQSSQPVAVVMT